VLKAAGYAGDIDTVLLLVSEVTTNAVRHAATPFELIVSVDGPSVTVTVVDHDRAHPPRLQDPGPEDTSGRGLLIVERLATSWGYESVEDDAKSVWFSMS
jgi:anti-sigma regulatory factor (Ser/Thr protein kinase)